VIFPSARREACLHPVVFPSLAPRKDRAFQNVDPNDRGFFPRSSEPWSPTLALVGFVGLCLLVAAADGGVTSLSLRTWYPSLTLPPGTPPNWVFGPVWGVLDVLVGVAGWLVWRRCGASRPVRLWGWQLLFNALWTPAFFGLRSPAIAFGILVILLVLIVMTVHAFARVRRVSAWLMAPYLAWTAYATYLNAGILWLNGP
jgi:tryptophan-rich sensory protein